jgi:SAM-dependent methyltransferase
MEPVERLLHVHGSLAAGGGAAYLGDGPAYAQAAVRWAVQTAPGLRVLDLGAGTGALSAALVAAGARVVAVEPDPGMLAGLRSAVPGVRVLPGSAEAIPLADGSVDAVLAGNSLQWFEMAAAGPEIARVLVPGGILAGLWNVLDDRVPWVAGFVQVSGGAAIGPRHTLGGWRGATAGMHIPRSGVARFGSPEQAEFAHGLVRSSEALVAAVAACAGVLVMPREEQVAMLGRIRGYLEGRPETVGGGEGRVGGGGSGGSVGAEGGEFVLPVLTGVLRVRKV